MFFTSSVPSRLQYIVRLLFEEISGLNVTFTMSKEEYLSFSGPKIAYCREDPGDGFFVESSGLLFEKKIFPHEVAVRRYRDIPILFESAAPALPGSAGGDTVFPFDILAAAFYLVSRYEEYLPFESDKYGRFPATSSMAYREGFLGTPVVNIWLKLFMERLSRKYASLMTHYEPYRYLPTIDIDHAYAYRNRSLFRTMGGIGRSLVHGRPGEVLGRFRALAGLSDDPFDTFSFIRSIHERHQLSTKCFLLFADYGGNDNNITVKGKGMRDLVQSLSGWSALGVHPSISASEHLPRLEAEIKGLSQAAGKEITCSRQHFLKFRLPEPFRQLGRLGITDEYSMGFASNPGFRAGIAHPFNFFDLAGNEETTLRIHPVQVMDVTFRDYLRLTPAESLLQIKQIISQVRLYNGEFVSLWHNESLSDTGRWKGWKRLYEEVVNEAAI